MNCRMDTKRKILLALGLRFEDKELVFPPTRRGFRALGLEPMPAFGASGPPGRDEPLS
jgi:hypothetical protein